MLAKKTTRIFGLFLVLMLACFMLLPVVSFAAPGDTLVNVVITEGVGGDNVKAAIKKVNDKYSSAYKTDDLKMWYKSKGKEVQIGEYKAETPPRFIILKDGWNELKDSERTKALKEFVDALNETADKDALHTFMNDVQQQDTAVGSVMLPMIMEGTTADLWQAYQIVKPFLDVLNVVLGVGCVLLILLLFFSTVMDLAYIGLPVWREAQASKEGGSKHPFGVSYEALTTVQEIEKGIGGGDGGYKNSYLLYFKRRALTYIILSICIMYLICGGISGIIAFVLNLTTGIV